MRPRLWQLHPERAAAAAAIVRPCPWCERRLRPCNLSRHVAAAHFRQLTIDAALAELEERQ